MRMCSDCGVQKENAEFNKSKRNKSGFDTHCKICRNEKEKKYRENNLEKVKFARKVYYNNNLEKMRLEKINYYKKNRQSKIDYDKIYREKNKEKILKYKKDWQLKNKDNLLFRIKRNLRRRIHHVLKGETKSASTLALLGCSFEEFILHIENQFVENMNWENYGFYGWHIDHIIPCYKFNLSDENQQKLCFHYSNQRPLWAKDNLSRPRD